MDGSNHREGEREGERGGEGRGGGGGLNGCRGADMRKRRTKKKRE